MERERDKERRRERERQREREREIKNGTGQKALPNVKPRISRDFLMQI